MGHKGYEIGLATFIIGTCVSLFISSIGVWETHRQASWNKKQAELQEAQNKKDEIKNIDNNAIKISDKNKGLIK